MIEKIQHRVTERQRIRDFSAPLLLWFSALIFVFIAAAVRFHNLGTQSLWYDEGVAYRHSLRTLPELIPLLQNNVHVPAYFTLLGWWQDLTGSSEFALRALSALFSIFSVAGTYALGKRLFHPIAGLAAAGFVTLNSFNIYYAQETRMYAMLTAIAILSMWYFVGFMRQAGLYTWRETPSLKAIVALGLINTLGIYTHVVFALVMIAQGIMAVLYFGGMIYESIKLRSFNFHRVNHAFLIYCFANMLTLVLFYPWVSVAISQISAQPNIAEPVALDLMLREIQGWFAFGNTYELNMGNMGFAIYFFLLFGLIYAPPQREQKRAWWTLLLPVVWVTISVVVYLYLDLGTRYLRFILPAQIAFALWIGRGVWVLWTRQTREQNSLIRYVPKFAAVFATGVLFFTMANGLDALYSNPKFQRDDYRGLAQTITSEIHENDAVIVSAAGVQEIFGYYYAGEMIPLPTTSDESETTQTVLGLIDNHKRIFAVFYGAAEQDPKGIVENTLSNVAYEISDEWFGDVRLVKYAAPANFEDVEAVDEIFGESIHLKSYALNAEAFFAGDLLQLQLEWMTSAPLDKGYKVFVQMLNSDGVLVAQRDSEPAGGLKATNTWEVGETIFDNHALVIPADLPAGDYKLIIGLYDINDAASRLAVGEGDYLELAHLSIQK